MLSKIGVKLQIIRPNAQKRFAPLLVAGIYAHVFYTARLSYVMVV